MEPVFVDIIVKFVLEVCPNALANIKYNLYTDSYRLYDRLLIALCIFEALSFSQWCTPQFFDEELNNPVYKVWEEREPRTGKIIYTYTPVARTERYLEQKILKRVKNRYKIPPRSYGFRFLWPNYYPYPSSDKYYISEYNILPSYKYRIKNRISICLLVPPNYQIHEINLIIIRQYIWHSDLPQIVIEYCNDKMLFYIEKTT